MKSEWMRLVRMAAAMSALAGGLWAQGAGAAGLTPPATGAYFPVFHFALCTGLNKYNPSYIPKSDWLNGCVPDAKNVYTNITLRGEWASMNAAQFLDSQGTFAAVSNKLMEIASKAKSGDWVLYYHSSHGYQDSGKNTGICMYDKDMPDSSFAKILANFRSGVKVVIVLDTCHSGGMFKSLRRDGSSRALDKGSPFAFAQRVNEELAAIRAGEAARGIKAAKLAVADCGWITAADYNQYSWDGDEGGAFTECFVGSVKSGACDMSPYGNGDFYATFKEMFDYAVAQDKTHGYGKPGSEYYTMPQCANTAVLSTVRFGWVGKASPWQTVTFKENGGVLGPGQGTERYKWGGGYSPLPSPKRLGYDFSGWWTEANGGQRITEYSIVTEEPTRILYAHWTPHAQVVTFLGNGGTPETQTNSYVVDGNYNPLPTATRVDYALTGWWTETNGGMQVMTNTTVSLDSERTLYAQWEQVLFPNLVGYKPVAWPAAVYLSGTKNGTNTVSSIWTGQRVYLNFCYANFGEGAAEAHAVAAVVKDASGTSITNWSWAEARLSTNACRGVTNIAFSLADAGDYTIEVTLDSEEQLRELDESDNTIRLEFTAMAPQVVTFLGNGGTPEIQTKTYAVGGKYRPLLTATREDYRFTGWWTAESGGMQVTTNTTVTGEPARTLFAQWEEIPKPNLVGYKPVAWPAAAYLAGTKNGTNTVSSIWTGQRVYLNFCYANFGEGTAEAHAVAAVVKDASGTTLTNWSWAEARLSTNACRGVTNIAFSVADAGDYTIEVTLDSEGQLRELDESDNTIQLEFTAMAPQVVTFQGNGGTPETQTKTYAVGGKYKPLLAATREDYRLTGWWTAANGGEQVTTNTTVTGEAARTLFAQWEEIPKPNLVGYKPVAWPAAAYLATAWGSTDMTTNVGTGETAYLNFCYANFGEGTAEAHAVAVVVKDASGTSVTNWSWASARLPTDACRGVTNIAFSVEEAGGYTVEVTLDSEEQLRELNESDNTIRLEFTAMAPQVVTFQGNDGTPETQTKTYAAGGKYDPLPTAERAGHDFGGWWTAADGGQQVTVATTVTTNPTRTLWAHWTEMPKPNLRAYKPVAWPASIYLATAWGSTNTTTNAWTGETAYLNFCYANVGTGAANSHRVAGTVLDAAGNAITNWNWKEWRLGTNACRGVTNIEFSVAAAGRYTVVVTLDSLGALAELDESDNEIRLDFTAMAPQTVTFDANGGTCETETNVYAVGGKYDPLPTAERADHDFGGWWTAAGEGGEQVTTTTMVTTNRTQTLWAHWTETPKPNLKAYKPVAWPAAIYLAQEWGSTSTTTNVWTGETAYLNFCYGNFGTGAANSHRVAGAVLDAAGNAVTNWNWKEGRLGTNACRGVTNIEFSVAAAGRYTVVVTLDSLGSLPELDESDNEIRLEFTAALPGEQLVTFAANGGTCGVAVQTYAVGEPYGELPSAKRSGGYAFLGWWTEQDGGEQVTEDSVVAACASLTLWAHWTDQQITTFLGNGGKPATQATTNTIYAGYGTFPEAKRSGHAFVGWFNAPEGGKRVYTNSTVTLAATRTLYAHWTDQQVTSFKANGGYPTTQTTTNTIYSDYGVFPEVKYSGHALVGWFNAPEGGKRVYTNSTVTLAAARTLYAQWTTNQVTTFKGNGGTPEIQKTTNAIYTHYGTLPEAVWENHVFLGWFNHPTKGKPVYTNSTVTLSATRTLYAHWTTARGFAITAIAVGAGDGDEGPAPRAVRGEEKAENVCRLRFELSAGTEYEIQWTASMEGKWETVERLTAETDGEVEVEIEVPGGEKGFFRLVVFDNGGEED